MRTTSRQKDVTAEVPGIFAEEKSDVAGTPSVENTVAQAISPAAWRVPSRLDRRWLVGICSALVLVAAGFAMCSCSALRSHLDGDAIARENAAVLTAAKNYVGATQAPDSTAMAASQQKVIECAIGDFRAPAMLYSGVLVGAYQAANVHVQVSDMRSAVERNNDDGSDDVLVAVRVKVSNIDAQGQEEGYRLRVKRAPADGRCKIAQLEQVRT